MTDIPSNLNAIPGLSALIVEDLCRLGYTDVESLIGQNPRRLCADLTRINPCLGDQSLPAVQRAVYYAETTDPDPTKLHMSYWKKG